jgi:integrase
VFFFTLYSLGLRLGEGLALTVGDVDAARMRVHVRDAKGNRDRLVPLPLSFLTVIRPPLLTVIRPAGCELRGISKRWSRMAGFTVAGKPLLAR